MFEIFPTSLNSKSKNKLIKDRTSPKDQIKKRETDSAGSTGLKKSDGTASSDEPLKEIVAKWGQLGHEGLGQIKQYHHWPTTMNKPVSDQAIQEQKKLDWKRRLENETTAWALQDSYRQMQESFRIFKSEEFHKIWELALKADASNEELEALQIAAKHFGARDQNAQSLKEAANQRFQDIDAHHKTVQNLDIYKATNWLNKQFGHESGKLENFQKAALQRATDLKSLREDMKAHQQTTKKIIHDQEMVSKTNQHLGEYTKTLADLEEKCKASKEYTESEYQQNQKKIGEWKTRIETNKLTVEIPKRVAEADERAKSYREMAKAAEERAKSYKEIAEAAEKRAERAKALGLNASDAETTAESAKEIANYESKLSAYAEQAAQQAEILKNTTISDSDKKSAFAAESDAIYLAENCLKYTKDHLDSQVPSLKREISATQSLQGSCEQEKKALEQLVTKLEAFEFLLKEVEDKETKAADATDKITKIIKTKGVTSQQIQDAKDQHIGFIDEARKAENKIKVTLQEITNYEKQVFGALSRQIAHTNLENPSNQQQAIKMLQELRINNISEKEKKKANYRGFEFDIGAARVSLPDGKGGKVWTEVRKINKWIPIDENTTRIEFRPDITDISISRQSRDAGKVVIEQIYAKRFKEETIENIDHKIELKAIGDSFAADDKRRMARLTYVDKKALRLAREAEATAAAAANRAPVPIDEAHYTKIEEFDMESTKKIHLMVDLTNEKNIVPGLSFDYTTETMPSPIIDHTKALRKTAFKYRENVAFFNLDTYNVEGSNGKEIPFSDLDWTESIGKDKDDGLVLRLQGPPEISHIRLDTALSKGAISQHEKEAQKLIDSYLEQSIKDLEKILSNTSDTTKIQEALRQLEKMQRLARLTADEFKRTFYSVPHDRKQYKKFQKEKSQKIPFIFKNLNDYLDKVAAMQKSRTNIDTNLYNSIKGVIPLNKHLYPRMPDMWKRDRKEWFNAEHLDQVFDSELLDNPLMAGTFIMETAEEAGKAAYTIEHTKTQSKKLANVAQRKVEDEIFHEVNQAILTYRDTRDAVSLEALRVSIRKSFYNAALLREKANAAQATQEFAQLIGDGVPHDTNRVAAKTAFITKAKDDCAKKSGDEMLTSILNTARVAIEIQQRRQGVTDNVGIINARRPVINAIQEAARHAINPADDIFTQKLNAVTAARKEAIRRLGEETFQAAKNSSFATGTQIENENEVHSLQRDIDKAENDAKTLWHKENSYGTILAKNTLQRMEEKIESIQKQARLANEDPEAAGAKTAHHIATIEIEKFEAARARLDASKTKDVRARTTAYKDTMDVQYSADSVRKPNLPGSAPRRAHMWIDLDTGQIKGHNDTALPFNIGHIGHIGDAQVHGQGRNTHAGIVFRNQVNNINNWDVPHTDLASEDDKWLTRARIYLQEPDGQGGYRDMLYMPNGKGIPLTYIDWNRNRHDHTGTTIFLRNDAHVPVGLRNCQFHLQSADKRGHLEIDPQTGKITMGNNHVAAVHFYLQDVATIGNAQNAANNQNTRRSHTGMIFKETLRDPNGNALNNWDVGHDYHLSASDDGWITKTYMHFLPNGQEGCVDMLHLADGTWLNVDHIDLTKTEYSSKDGVTIVLKNDDPVPVELRDRKFNLKRIAQAVHGNLTKVEEYEASALLATREATKKRLWSQAEEDVLEAVRTIADLQELPKTAPVGAGPSPYDIAINQARVNFTTFANTARDKIENNLKRSAADTADGTRGQIDEKNAAWLEAAQRYAQGQKSIADATKKAVDAAEATAQLLGEDDNQARHRIAYVLRSLTDLAQNTDIDTGGDGLTAAVKAAEEAAASELTIAKAVKTAYDAAQLRASKAGYLTTAEAGQTSQETYARDIARDVRDSLIRERDNILAKALATAVQEVASARNETSNVEITNIRNELTNRSNTINAKIDAYITQDMIPNAEARAITRNRMKAVAITQWATTLIARAEAGNAAKDLAITKRRTEAQQGNERTTAQRDINTQAADIAMANAAAEITRKNTIQGGGTNAAADLAATNARNNVINAADFPTSFDAVPDTAVLVALASAAINAKERAKRYQAAAQAGKAASDIARVQGQTEAQQITAAQNDGQAIMNEPDLATAVRDAEYLAQLANAVTKAAEAARITASPENADAAALAAVQAVLAARDVARNRNPGNPAAADEETAIDAAKVAVTLGADIDPDAAGQAVRNAVNQVRAIKDAAQANQIVAEYHTEQVHMAEQYITAETEITEITTEAVAIAEATAKANRQTDTEQKAVGQKAGQKVLASYKEARENLAIINENRYIKDKSSIKAARETLVSLPISVTRDGESIEKASTAAFNTVQDSASKTSRDMMQKSKIGRDIAFRHNKHTKDDILEHILSVTQQMLDSITLQANSDVEISTRKFADLTSKNADELIENSREYLRVINHNARRLVWIQGGDKIAEDTAVAAAVTAYATAQVEIARAAETAFRDAHATATLAGRDANVYAKQAAKDVIARAKAARHAAALAGKNQIEQDAAAAAAAASFAASQAEVRQSAEAAARSARDRASLEGLPQDTAAQNATGDVIDEFKRVRIQAAEAKIAQAELDAAIFARESGLAQGLVDIRLRNYINNKVAVVSDAARHARNDPRNSGLSEAARAEAAAQAAASRAITERAVRDTALAVRVIDELQGLQGVALNNAVTAAITSTRKSATNAEVDAQIEGKDRVIQNAIAAETAIHIATQWRAIESAARAASAVEDAKGWGPVVQRGATQNITQNITQMIRATIASETLPAVGTDKLTAQSFATEVAKQLAAVQNARLTAALAGRNATARAYAGSPYLNGIQNTAAQRAVDDVNAAIQNNPVAPFLPTNIPAGYNPHVVGASIKARLALRVATSETKVTQAVEASALIARDIKTKATDPNDANLANILAEAERTTALNTLNAADNARGLGGTDPAADAAVAALRELKAYTAIAEFTKEAERYTEAFSSIAFFNVNRIAQAKRSSVDVLFNESNNSRLQPGGADPLKAAITTAKQHSEFYAQTAKAAKRLVDNAAGNTQIEKQANARANVQALINEIFRVANTNPANPVVALARTAAQGAENLLQNRPVDQAPAPGGAMELKGNEAQQAIEAAVSEVSRVFDGTGTIRDAEVARMFDDIEAVTRNAGVVQAMDDAARAAAAAENLAGGDQLAQAVAAIKAAQAVRRAAITARNNAKAKFMDEYAQNTAAAEAAEATAARFLTRHAEALSAQEMADAKRVNQAGQQQAARAAINNLDTTLSQQALSMAGLVLAHGAFTAVVGDTIPINKAKAAIQQSRKTLGETNAEQTIAATNLERKILTAAARARHDVIAAGGDEVEANLAAAAVVEHLVAIELAVRDAALAAQETAELTCTDKDEEAREKAKKDAAKQAIKDVRSAVKSAQKNAKDSGMNKYAQISAGVYAAINRATIEKNIRDTARLHIDKDINTVLANKNVGNVKSQIEKARQATAKETAPAILGDFVEKYLKMVDKAIPVPDDPGHIGSVTAQNNYREKLQENTKAKEDILRSELSFQTQKDITIGSSKSAAAAAKTFSIRKSITDIQKYRIENLGPAPIVGLPIYQVLLGDPVGFVATQDHVDAYNQQAKDIKAKTERDVLQIVNDTQLEVSDSDNNVITQFADVAAAVAKYTSQETGGNLAAQAVAADKAKQEVEAAALTLYNAVKVAQNTYAAAVSVATLARIREVEQAMSGLNNQADKEKVQDAAQRAQTRADKAGKNLIVQQAEAAAAAAEKASELASGDANARAAAADKARRAVEAAATEVDTVKASGDMTTQTTLAIDAARQAKAHAQIAHVVKVVAPYAQTLQVQLAAAEINPGVTPADATKLVTQNIMDLVAATQAKHLAAHIDPITALEKAAEEATAYGISMVGKDAIERNPTASTAVKGFAALAERYASKGAGQDKISKDAVLTDIAHVLNTSEKAGIKMAEDIAKKAILQIFPFPLADQKKREEALKELTKEMKNAVGAAKADAKARGKNEATAAIEAAMKVAAAKVTLAKEVKKATETIPADTSNQVVSKMAREIKEVSIAKQEKALKDALTHTITQATTTIQTDITPFGAAITGLGTTIQQEVNAARVRIQQKAEAALDEAAQADKDLITQYTEAIAAATAQGAIESAKIRIIATDDQASRATGWGALSINAINIHQQRVDMLVEQAKANAGLDVIQQYITAAATAKKIDSTRVQFAQSITAIANARNQQIVRNTYRTSMHKARIMFLLFNRKNSMQQEMAKLNLAKREQSRLVDNGNAAAQETAAINALQIAEREGDTAAQTVRNTVNQARNGANEAYTDAAKQQAEVGITLGRTLEVVSDPAQDVADALGAKPEEYAKFFSGLVMELYEQAKEEAQANPNLTLEQRIQAQTKVLTQVREMVPKLAKAMEDTARATRAYRLAALADKDTAKTAAYKEAKKVFEIANKKRADIKATHGDLSTQIAAGIDAATQIAACAVGVQKAIQHLTTQVIKDLDRLNITQQQKDQIIMRVANEALDEIHQRQADAYAKGHDVGSKEFTTIAGRVGMEILFRVRTDTTLSTQAFDKTLKEVVQKIEDEVSVPSTSSKLNPLQFFEKYSRYLKNPNPDLADQARLKKIEAFFEKPDNGVHPYWQNQYYFRRAIQAAGSKHFHHDNSAGHYIARMKIVPEPDRTSTKPEDLRQGFEHDWVTFLNEALQQSLRLGGSDELIGDALAAVDIQMQKRYKNIKPVIGEMETAQEILKALDDMDITEVSPPAIDPGEEVTDPRAAMKRRGEERLNHNYTLKELEARTPLERALDNQALTEFFLDASQLAYEGLLERADPETLAALKENSVKILTELNQRMWEDYKREDAKHYEILKMTFYRKEADKQFWRGFFKDWALLWLRNAINDGSKAEKDAMDQLWKLITKALG